MLFLREEESWAYVGFFMCMRNTMIPFFFAT